MATYSSVLAWEIPQIEEPGWVESDTTDHAYTLNSPGRARVCVCVCVFVCVEGRTEMSFCPNLDPIQICLLEYGS